MRHTYFIATGLLCALLGSFSSTAAAEAPGSWSVGIERVFGFSSATTKTKQNGVSRSQTSNQISLFSHTLDAQPGYPGGRLTLDYLFPSGLTLGGAIGYQSYDPNTDQDDDTVRGWLLEPRVGYFASVSGNFGIWPRGGLTYVTISTGNGGGPNYTALSVEVPLVLRIAGNVCFSAMPYVDLGLGGGTDNVDQKITEIGLQFGMNAFF
jgi:hypothetical protein